MFDILDDFIECYIESCENTKLQFASSSESSDDIKFCIQLINYSVDSLYRYSKLYKESVACKLAVDIISESTNEDLINLLYNTINNKHKG